MKDLIDLIKYNSQNYPDRIAVIDGDRKISYSEFFNLVKVISNSLLLKTQTPKIVFDLEQGIEAYALIVATLNVGGTYCPLNPDAPINRKYQIISEFQPDFIIVKEIISETLHQDEIVFDNLYVENNTQEIEISYKGEDIIYVIYTSGTTGMPKGVKICRKALNKFLEWSIPTYNAGDGDIWGQFSFLSFDLSIVDIFTCLCSGATLLAMSDTNARKYRPSSVIENQRITIWHSIPSAVDFMIVNEKAKVFDFSSLRLLSFCAEPLKKHQVEFLFGKNKDLIVFNTYGPTEGTLFCTWQELKSNNYLNFFDFTMSIGKAIPGWNIKLNSVEDFTEKEIIIYGDFIGKGYLGEVVDTKFKEIVIDGQIIQAFETGDLVNEKNGNLYFSCRKDRQVKIKGFRVELDEIDLKINQFLKKNSVTIQKKDSLYSFIESDEKIKDEELREHLKKELEPYKIPNNFYSINEFPRSQNQKIDNNSLLKLIP